MAVKRWCTANATSTPPAPPPTTTTLRLVCEPGCCLRCCTRCSKASRRPTNLQAALHVSVVVLRHQNVHRVEITAAGTMQMIRWKHIQSPWYRPLTLLHSLYNDGLCFALPWCAPIYGLDRCDILEAWHRNFRCDAHVYRQAVICDWRPPIKLHCLVCHIDVRCSCVYQIGLRKRSQLGEVDVALLERVVASHVAWYHPTAHQREAYTCASWHGQMRKQTKLRSPSCSETKCMHMHLSTTTSGHLVHSVTRHCNYVFPAQEEAALEAHL